MSWSIATMSCPLASEVCKLIAYEHIHSDGRHSPATNVIFGV